MILSLILWLNQLMVKLISMTLSIIHGQYFFRIQKISHQFVQLNLVIWQKFKKNLKKEIVRFWGLSIDSVEDHLSWKKDIEDVADTKLDYPLISDSNLKVAKAFNMLPADEVANTNRTAITNATVRSVFLIDPEKKIRMMLTYPMTTGRNFDEILRVLDSIQLTSKTKVATPVNWEKR